MNRTNLACFWEKLVNIPLCCLQGHLPTSYPYQQKELAKTSANKEQYRYTNSEKQITMRKWVQTNRTNKNIHPHHFPKIIDILYPSTWYAKTVLWSLSGSASGSTTSFFSLNLLPLKCLSNNRRYPTVKAVHYIDMHDL